jgi:hypothetical protein
VVEIRRIRVDEALAVRDLYRAAVQEAAARHPEDRSVSPNKGSTTLKTHFRLGLINELWVRPSLRGGGEERRLAEAAVAWLRGAWSENDLSHRGRGAPAARPVGEPRLRGGRDPLLAVRVAQRGAGPA